MTLCHVTVVMFFFVNNLLHGANNSSCLQEELYIKYHTLTFLYSYSIQRTTKKLNL